MKTIVDGRVRTTYFDQVKVDVSSDLRTVTGHAVLTRGQIVFVGGDDDPAPWSFCWEDVNAPKELPQVDNSHPLGSPFSLK